MLSISRGLETTLNVPSSALTYGFVGIGIVLAFVLSSATGLMKGIRILST